MTINRYIKLSDPKVLELKGLLLTDWSRPYEYLYMESLIKDPKGIAVDVGSGEPEKYPFPFVLTEKYERVYGVDVRRIINHKVVKKVTYKIAEAWKMPFESGKINAVFCISVLEHFKEKDIIASAEEFARVSAPGSYLYLSFMISNDINKPSPSCNFFEHQINGKGIFCGEKYGVSPQCKIQVTPQKMLSYFEPYFVLDGETNYDKPNDILTSANRLTFCCRLKKI